MNGFRDAVPGALVTVTNTDNGWRRFGVSNDDGIFRFPLLPLGAFQVLVEADGYRKAVREGVLLSAGQTATIHFILEAGEVAEEVIVNADAGMADAGTTALARIVNQLELESVALVNRDPFNLGILQSGVTGHPNRSFGFPLFNANGLLRRVSYLLDGNTNTQADQASIRLMIISDTYVKEIQLLTNGFSAEFGNTAGMVMNVITPTGTNKLKASLTYRLRLPAFYSRPFFYPASKLPDNWSNGLSAVIGGPMIRDRWQYYAGFEWIKRDDKATAARLLTIREEDRMQLVAAGLPESIFPPAIPSTELSYFFILRSDAQLGGNNSLSVRYNHSDLFAKNFIRGGLNTLERGTNSSTTDHGFAIQLGSFTQHALNELRFQYAQRGPYKQCRNEFTGSGPGVVITGVANFGSPACADKVPPPLSVIQLQENLTLLSGNHAWKFGGGVTRHYLRDRAAAAAVYTFDSIDSYVEASSGMNRLSYGRYQETFGEPESRVTADFWSAFAQDEWLPFRRLKIAYGMRYDLYQVPKADPLSPYEPSRRFNTDRNNFAPRIGIAYGLREGLRPTILRVSAGIYYDQPQLQMYERALRNNGIGKWMTVSFTRSSVNAPLFPETFSGSLPSGTILPPLEIDAVSPDFENMYAFHSGIQIEQGISRDLSVVVGFVRSAARHIPVYRNVNCIATDETLSDGRPIYGNPFQRTCVSRLLPDFQNILMAESVGNSEYNALVLRLNRRFSGGFQFNASYTFSKATDDAPEQNTTTQGIQGLVLSDPSNRRLDRGPSFADQRHTFVVSVVVAPVIKTSNKFWDRTLNNNQIGMIMVANSGETFNIIAGQDLNRDGISTSDRPSGIPRNSGTTPPLFNLDFRYSRSLAFGERFRLELFGEFQNLLNVNGIIAFNNVAVDTNLLTGEMIGPLPDFKARNQSTAQESRQIQAGIKIHF